MRSFRLASEMRSSSPLLNAAKATEAVIKADGSAGGTDKQEETSGNNDKPSPTAFTPEVTFEAVRASMFNFASERDWFRYHQPRSLVLALTGEVGELAELFMWRGDHGARPGLPSWTEAEKVHLGEELSDVLLYLIRLSDTCGIDLPAAALRKMKKNAEKYPADKCRGKSDKYTAYDSGNTPVGAAATLKPSAKLLLNNSDSSKASGDKEMAGEGEGEGLTVRRALSFAWDGLVVANRVLSVVSTALFVGMAVKTLMESDAARRAMKQHNSSKKGFFL